MTPRDRTGWWAARSLRPASRADRVALALVVVLAAVVLGAGRRARDDLKPRAAVANARLLDALEVPARLPNAPVVDADGARTPIFDRMKKDRAVVAFYAAWCGPCQREIPQLVVTVGEHADLLVVVGADEDIEATRRQLANLGVGDRGLLVDETRQLGEQGRVTALPTTFLVSRAGAVLQRSVGFSSMELYRLRTRLAPPDDRPSSFTEAE